MSKFLEADTMSEIKSNESLTENYEKSAISSEMSKDEECFNFSGSEFDKEVHHRGKFKIQISEV